MREREGATVKNCTEKGENTLDLTMNMGEQRARNLLKSGFSPSINYTEKKSS